MAGSWLDTFNGFAFVRNTRILTAGDVPCLSYTFHSRGALGPCFLFHIHKVQHCFDSHLVPRSSSEIASRAAALAGREAFRLDVFLLVCRTTTYKTATPEGTIQPQVHTLHSSTRLRAMYARAIHLPTALSMWWWPLCDLKRKETEQKANLPVPGSLAKGTTRPGAQISRPDQHIKSLLRS